ncbi:MAG: CPBP family intramembrane metalloprotease [Pirellulaceae bacterium]|jgi:sodium transport system permease protein|nr:ABC transporter permease subunit [Thermoguttaceae bacterium]MDI9446497.1 ABC transporter permease subunit/CPBP intramembrane protease [Planctomycetota bacterium]NLZ03055.1 CPBP family intramembrane metalloprotease [Pirellulaceae bacterium]
MRWANVKLILARELRDQMRDRRTMFMIAVLPVLLYPLLGMSLFQMAQFMEEKPSRVLVTGVGGLVGREDLPALLDPGEHARFDARLFREANQNRLLEVAVLSEEPAAPGEALADPRRQARSMVEQGAYDAALVVPPELPDRLAEYRRAIAAGEEAARPEVHPEIIYSTANEKSQIAFGRLYPVIESWIKAVGEINLKAAGVPAHAARPVAVGTADVAGQTRFKGAALWSKALPVVLLLWAMTGAFYPAIDLCAGEKERGTLETLLSSPAERSEIVLGKLLTVMLFSMGTAALNLVSMGLTGWLLLSRMPQFASPPPQAILWLGLALVPVAALYGALCLALAAFAKSTKEGQYYLMPLLLITMPLVIMPMTPNAELDLGNSLVPVTGIVLLLRKLLEGAYWEALRYLPVVALVTLGCCALAIRWAVEQFNSEAVLFRESERLDLRLWLRQVFRDRRPTPTASAAVVCGVSILMLRFVMNIAPTRPLETFRDFAVLALITQLAVILAPLLILTFSLTTNPARTLLLRGPRPLTIPAAVLLALVLHPAVRALQVAVMQQLYPPNEEMIQLLVQMQELFNAAPLWAALGIVAAVPAICEELAFRGFILSGFRHLGRKWRAIIFSAIFFGLSHAILQQSIIATAVGIVIGYLAVQTGSIWPGVLFHFVHNSLGVLTSRPELIQQFPALARYLGAAGENGPLYQWPSVLVCSFAAIGLLAWFSLLPVAKSDEELQREEIARIRDAGPGPD